MAMGAIGGAAVGVLISVYGGTLPGGPLVLPALTAALGAGVMSQVPADFRPPTWVKVVGGVLFAALVLVAAIYVIAAIALSSFE